MWGQSTEKGAGGFLDASYTEGEQSESSQSGDRVRGSAVVPVMIGHLYGKPVSTLSLWKQKISLVSIVGYVKNLERVTTKVSYQLVDETGSIQAIEWIKVDRKKGPADVPIGSYARVVGTPREQQGKPHLMILKIMPITRMDELYEHLLEVTYLCLKGRELFMKDKNASPVKAAQAENNDEESFYGMNSDQAIVFKLIKSQNPTDTGIERSALVPKLPANFRGSLDNILEFLISEGHIYTTCTDDHFKST